MLAPPYVTKVAVLGPRNPLQLCEADLMKSPWLHPVFKTVIKQHSGAAAAIASDESRTILGSCIIALEEIISVWQIGWERVRHLE